MNEERNNTAEYGRTKGLFGETDRDSGEYHFRSGYTQQVYTNAHFVPVEESTTPPRYYRPAEKSAERASGITPDAPADKTEGRQKNKENNKNRKKTGIAGVLLLCLLAGLAGGVLGAFLTGLYLRESSSGRENALTGLASAAESEEATYDAVAYDSARYEGSVSEEAQFTASGIYERACSQTVCISVETVSYDIYGYQIPSVVSGSGLVISTEGYILTNYHVVQTAVEGALNVTITFNDGSVSIGRVVGAAEDEDLAVIKIEKEGLSAATFGSSEELSVGDEVYVVGNPYGILEFTMTTGHVSALDRVIATEEKESELKMFQIDAAVYSGNSGGPVYNRRGEVVGIVTAKYTTSGMEGIGFAIPINEAMPVVRELVEKGYVSGKAALGVRFDSRYNTIYSRYYRLPDGAFVSTVSSESCAEKAGIRSGDIIMQIGDYTIQDYDDVPSALRHFSAGETAQVRIYRDGQILAVTLTFDEDIPSVAAAASSL